MAIDKQDFFDRVYDVVRRIPSGMVTTYGAIAEVLGMKSSARMIGWALNGVGLRERNDLPCHRVVNRNGDLSGRMHFETPFAMRERLEAEGVGFIDDRVDLAKHFWKP